MGGTYTIGRVQEPSRPGCALCGRATFDPGKRDRPWVRGVSNGHQALICPTCQQERAGWQDSLDRCPSCASPRLSAMLGEVVCRACGKVAGPSSSGA